MGIFAAPPFAALFSPHLMIRYPLLLTQTDTGGGIFGPQCNESFIEYKTITPLLSAL